MTFQWIGLLAAILLVPLLVALYAWSQRRRRRPGARYSSLALIRVALPGSSRVRRHLPFGLLASALAIMVVALARPSVVLSIPTNRTTIILTIDVSGSMCSTDIDPTRLEAAENAAISFVKSQKAETQIGIVAFSGFAAVVQAPTTNQDDLVSAIKSLTTGRRTAIGSGILAAIDAISEVDPTIPKSIIPGRGGVEPPPVLPGAYAPDIIVLLTDGASNAGPDPQDAATQAADRGLRVYTIGFGTADGADLDPTCRQQFLGNEPGGGVFGGGGFSGGGFGGFPRGIDEDALKKVADLTGGTYYPADTAAQLVEVFQNLPTTVITKHEVVEVSFGFVGLGTLLVGVALLLGRAWRPLP